MSDLDSLRSPSGSPAIRGAGWRVLHVLWALALAALVVVPNLPSSVFGPGPSRATGALRPISFAQNWRMYVPNPQRSQTYMNLVAHYAGGRTVDLEETLVERAGWGGTWAGAKTRVDIWRHYANLHPKRPSKHRTWYLRAVCVREARKGEIPTKIVMAQVRRRFTSPAKVRKGRPGLGRKRRRTVAWMPCKTTAMRRLIDADRARRGQRAPTEGGR